MIDVCAYTALAASIAKRYRGRGERFDDLQQVAMLGLVKAANRFDPARGVAFATYATVTVEGELKRHFRQRWKLHVRRGDQERYLAVREADEVLTHRLCRRPTVRELSSATGIDPNRVEVAMSVGAAFGVESLHTRGNGRATYDVAIVDDRFDRLVEVESLKPLIAALSERDREVLRLRFGAGLSQTEIAGRLGVSQMEISRTLKRVLAFLRQRLDPDIPQPCTAARKATGSR